MEPQAYWNYYHLLGYWCELTGMQLADTAKYPSRHPELLHLYDIVAKLNGLRYRPFIIDMSKIIHFLEWSAALADKQRVKITSLNYLLNNKPKADGTTDTSRKSWMRIYKDGDKHIQPKESAAEPIKFEADQVDVPCEVEEAPPTIIITVAKKVNNHVRKETPKRYSYQEENDDFVYSDD